MKIYDFLYYVLLLPGAFFAPVIHESVKALCSARLGDPTPKRNGFLSFNPFRYFETVGFFCMMIFGYGWGQPVPTSPMYYKDRRRGVFITYITPSVVNLLVGLAAAALTGLLDTLLSPLIFAANPPAWTVTLISYLFQALYLFAQCNVGLAFFNLIPIPPLDGAKILQLFLSPDWAVRMTQQEKTLQFLLLILMGFGAVSFLFDPLVNALLKFAL